MTIKEQHREPAERDQIVGGDGAPVGSIAANGSRFAAFTVSGRFIASFPNASNARRTLHWLKAMGAEDSAATAAEQIEVIPPTDGASGSPTAGELRAAIEHILGAADDFERRTPVARSRPGPLILACNKARRLLGGGS